MFGASSELASVMEFGFNTAGPLDQDTVTVCTIHYIAYVRTFSAETHTSSCTSYSFDTSNVSHRTHNIPRFLPDSAVPVWRLTELALRLRTSVMYSCIKDVSKNLFLFSSCLQMECSGCWYCEFTLRPHLGEIV